MITLITEALRALVWFLKLKNKTAEYDLARRIEHDIQADENEIARLRALPDAGSQSAAKRLRQRVLRAQGIAASAGCDLPAADAEPAGGRAGANDGGGLHTPAK